VVTFVDDHVTIVGHDVVHLVAASHEVCTDDRLSESWRCDEHPEVMFHQCVNCQRLDRAQFSLEADIERLPIRTLVIDFEGYTEISEHLLQISQTPAGKPNVLRMLRPRESPWTRMAARSGVKSWISHSRTGSASHRAHRSCTSGSGEKEHPARRGPSESDSTHSLRNATEIARPP
jgi:hypothetical protein